MADLDALMQQANAAFAEGRIEDCLTSCRLVLEELPDSLPALVLAGAATFRSSDPTPAIPFFERAIAADKTCAPAYLWLSMTFQKAGQLDASLAPARMAATLNPGDPMALHQLGRCLLGLGKVEEAVIPLEKAAALAPNVAQPHLTMGLALKQLKLLEPAIRELRRAARLDPNSTDALVELRQILMEQMDVAGAAEAARAILAISPDSPQGNLWMAQSLLESGKNAEAEPFLNRAVELEPNTAEAHYQLGLIHQVHGRLAESSNQFQQSIDLNPIQGSAYLGLVSNIKISKDEQAVVDKMRNLLEEPSLAPFAKSELNYALGKAYENLEEYRTAMSAYDEANRLAYQIKFGDRSFDRNAAASSLQTTIDRMDREFLERNAAAGSSDPTPIFVVGMIRSGTTLAEQILSAHPQVGAAGEQSFWLENGGAFSNRNKAVDPTLLGKFSERYIGLLRSLAPKRDRVVDKMPMNYLVIGLLKVAYPNAKIIHIQRHPIDTCLSVYTTPNRTRLGWAHNKANIAFNYKQYLRLMDHWRAVLAPGDLLDIRYEELVADLETNAKAMIAFCGLDWNEACLRPQDNERLVVTPSVWQVRQPVYTTSVDRWKRYQGMLGPIEALN